ncbi:ATP-binding protein [bacterium]|nr:ATP-binding protein [bacterium]
MYNRSFLCGILKRINEPKRFIQVISGPRQVGKTTLIQQAMKEISIQASYHLADEPMVHDRIWIEQNWEVSRLKVREKGEALIIFDEIQKVEDWSETVKRLWDEDKAKNVALKIFLLGSSPLLVQKGLTESLAGRFEIINIPHWSYKEMNEAFGWPLEKFVYFGGYPGSAELVADDEARWKKYINDSLIETTILKDILLMKRIDKPALLKRLFYLGCQYSGQILSYQKMVGQLQDVGNTTTLAHYLSLLGDIGLICGLEKYAPGPLHHRGSSPKFQVFNNALMSASMQMSFKEIQNNRDIWGRFVESAVGSHLVNSFAGINERVSYWRERESEIDFVLSNEKEVIGIEVKSGRRKEKLMGMGAFQKKFKPDKVLLVGADGISIEKFLKTSPQSLFK